MPAYFATDGLSNDGTEAINMPIVRAGRLTNGHGDFDNYRPRVLLAANGTRTPLPSEDDVTTLESEEPVQGTDRLRVQDSAPTASAPRPAAHEALCVGE